MPIKRKKLEVSIDVMMAMREDWSEVMWSVRWSSVKSGAGWSEVKKRAIVSVGVQVYLVSECI